MKTLNSWTLVDIQKGEPLVVFKDGYISGLLRTREIARTTQQAISEIYGTKLYRVAKVKIEVE